MATKTRPNLLALLTAPVVSAVVLAGVWLAGGVVSTDFRTSMALTALWFAISGAAVLLLARRWRPLRIPMIAAFVLTAGATGAYLGDTTLRDRVVDEQVITAAATPEVDATVAAHAADARAPKGPVELARGRFRSHEHATVGTARVIRAPDGRRFLTLTSFSTSAGPDLRVRLVPTGSIDGGVDGAIDLGGLKGNRGDQQYRVPPAADLDGLTVVIWCRAFSAPFGSAALRA
jgi:hypothetical protein